LKGARSTSGASIWWKCLMDDDCVCKGRGWLVVDVDNTGTLRVEKCDACDKYENDRVAEQAALEVLAELIR